MVFFHATDLGHSKQHLLDINFEYLLSMIEEYAIRCTMSHAGLKDIWENKQQETLAVQIMMDLPTIQSAKGGDKYMSAVAARKYKKCITHLRDRLLHECPGGEKWSGDIIRECLLSGGNAYFGKFRALEDSVHISHKTCQAK